MPEKNVSVPVPVYNITVPKGATRVVRVVIAKSGLNVNLSAPSTQVIFTAKVRDSDAVPAFQKSYASAGTTLHAGVTPGGIAVSQIDADGNFVLDTWVADVTISPADTETLDVSYLSYDVWLIDSVQEVPVAEGRLRIAPTTFRF